MKAWKIPSGKWRSQVYIVRRDKTVDRKSFTAPTKAEAVRLAKEYEVSHVDLAGSDLLPLSDACQRYIDSRAGVLSPTTITAYRSYLATHIRPAAVGDMPIGTIDNADLQYFISLLAASHTPKSVRNIYGLISSTLKVFLPEKTYRVTLPARRPVSRSIPTDRQVSALIMEADPELRKAILLAAVGTLRRGEVCALKYKDISYDLCRIYVHADLIQNEDSSWIYKDMPKTVSSIRCVTLPRDVIDALGHGEPEDYVVPINPHVLTTRFCDLRDRLGFQCRFHDLRHYSASIMHAIGIPDAYIELAGGWRSGSGVLKQIYENPLDDKKLSFTSKVNHYFEQKILKNYSQTTHDTKKKA